MTHEKRHNFTVFLATVLQDKKKDACLADTTALGCTSPWKSLRPSLALYIWAEFPAEMYGRG